MWLWTCPLSGPAPGRRRKPAKPSPRQERIEPRRQEPSGAACLCRHCDPRGLHRFAGATPTRAQAQQASLPSRALLWGYAEKVLKG